MKDFAIAIEDRPEALAELGETLGAAGVNIEGGGVAARTAHYLFHDAPAARAALDATGIRVLAENEVLMLNYRQEQPGEFGRIARKLAEAGVSIEVQYSDHDHNLILLVDDMDRGRVVLEEWKRHATRA
jgi:hypothetical protein